MPSNYSAKLKLNYKIKFTFKIVIKFITESPTKLLYTTDIVLHTNICYVENWDVTYNTENLKKEDNTYTKLKSKAAGKCSV